MEQKISLASRAFRVVDPLLAIVVIRAVTGMLFRANSLLVHSRRVNTFDDSRILVFFGALGSSVRGLTRFSGHSGPYPLFWTALSRGFVWLHVLFFKFYGTDSTERGVSPVPITEAFDVFEDCVGQLDTGAPFASIQQFDLQSSPERFDHGVDFCF